MKRKALDKIKEWNEKTDFKPLVLNGARQVGKTWLLKEFGKEKYPDNFIYVNFEEETSLRDLFASDFDVKRIESVLSLIKKQPINEKTLFIFDELQEAPRGITALKYFHENAPGRRVICAGSMLGIAMHRGDSFPVGKVDMLDVYPMDFEEFQWATGNSASADLLQRKDWNLISFVKEQIITQLKQYYVIGGMPAAVLKFKESGDFQAVREIQNTILRTYELDFSKHAPVREVPRIRMVWESVPAQLAKENRKFIYGMVREGARAKDFEVAIEWLKDAGLIYQVRRCHSGEIPLKAYMDFNSFKIYLLDVGLLGAFSQLSYDTIVDGNVLFSTFKGALTEQYVCQQLICDYSNNVYYWSADNSRGEVDFLIQWKEKVMPIEVKASENLKSKSLAAFRKKFHLADSWRFSLSDYREQDAMTNYPLYAIDALLTS